MHIAVTGGAGYIGSHMCRTLAEHGHSVTVIDDLSTGHAAAVQWGQLERCSILDPAALAQVFARARFDAVIHFAGAIVVSESVTEPLAYYRANFVATLNLVEAMRASQVTKLVFSSTAAIFGEPLQDAIDESHPVAPLSPYGHSKAMVEQLLRDCSSAYGIDAVALRYFNAAGADTEARIGEAHDPETHLIPRLLQLAAQPDAPIAIYGTDHPTPDGTCVRDYVHVDDLCAAHLLALQHLEQHRGFHAFNLGHGHGYSVLEVLRAVETVTGRRLRPSLGPRRAGDAARLVASPRKAIEQLGWQPSRSALDVIVETAWRWQQSRRY